VAYRIGYNHNVRYKGEVYHVQTEDSGEKTARIVTHVFADGGRIIASRTTRYHDYLEREDLDEAVKKIMKDQHKALIRDLLWGEFHKDEEASAKAGQSDEPARDEGHDSLEVPVSICAAGDPLNLFGPRSLDQLILSCLKGYGGDTTSEPRD
jgi:hypothetical protein